MKRFIEIAGEDGKSTTLIDGNEVAMAFLNDTGGIHIVMKANAGQIVFYSPRVARLMMDAILDFWRNS